MAVLESVHNGMNYASLESGKTCRQPAGQVKSYRLATN